MSTLTTNLNKIYNWLESVNPNPSVYNFTGFNPGLTKQEFDSIVKELPFTLSREVCELYRWRNGIDYSVYAPNDEFLFPEQLYDDVTILFLSLKEAVKAYRDLDKGSSGGFWNSQWFPIASFEDKRILFVIGDMDPSPVILWDIDVFVEPVRVYQDLSSLIAVIVECCEIGLYRVSENEYGRKGVMRFQTDETKLDIEKSIFQKYNSQDDSI
jgi:hypothetical protein